MATGEDFEKGEPWPDLDGAIIHARESVRQDGRLSWIRCDEKFVLSPPKGIGVPPRGGTVASIYIGPDRRVSLRHFSSHRTSAHI